MTAMQRAVSKRYFKDNTGKLRSESSRSDSHHFKFIASMKAVIILNSKFRVNAMLHYNASQLRWLWP